MKRLLNIWVLAGFFLPGTAHYANAQQLDTIGFSASLHYDWEQSGVKAMNFGFVTRGGQRYSKSFGPSVWAEDNPLTADHIFRIASMTKAITSVAVLQLWERGLIALDDPADKYFPGIDSIPVLLETGELVIGLKPITIRHLLTHTSGFGYLMFDQRLAGFERPAEWPHADYPRLAEAGTEWIYSTSTDWAGKIVEVVSGLSLEEYLRNNISGPLNMDHTWFNVPEALQHLIVSIGRRNDRDNNSLIEFPERVPARPVKEYSGGGGLFSSLNDYLTFLECILNGGELNGNRILNEETVELLFVDQLPDVLGLSEDKTINTNQRAHGLTWAIQLTDNDFGRRAGSGYWSGYFNTYYSIDINTGIAVVSMSNLLPFLDNGSLDLYKTFERLVRQN
jgi:CubicO group peptidase (beta-lactamase class C family)